MPMCKDCRYFDRASSDIEQNHRCKHTKSEYQVGGIVTDAATFYTTCEIMLKSQCLNHRLWEQRTNV